MLLERYLENIIDRSRSPQEGNLIGNNHVYKGRMQSNPTNIDTNRINQAPLLDVQIIYTIHGRPTMTGHSGNSRKRYTREARDTDRLIYRLRLDGLVYPITFVRREVLLPHDYPLVIKVKIAHCEL